MRHVLTAVALSGILSVSLHAEESEPIALRVGVWLNHHLMAEGEEAIRSFIAESHELGVNELYPNFWFHGYTAYPGSKYADQHPKFADFDPIQIVVDEADKRGMKVFAWAEYGFFTHFNRTIDPEDKGAILINNPEWGVIAADGNNFLENKSLGVAHFSVNPGHPEARAYIRGLFLEVMDRYPSMDGFNLDRIRYQSPDFSYDDYTRAEYKKLYGVDPIEYIGQEDVAASWTTYREAQTSAFAAEFAEAFRAKFPEKEINAAVAPPYLNEEKFQRWDIWSRSGHIDVAIPMIYGNMGLVQRELERTRELIGPDRTFMAGLDLRAVNDNLSNAIQLSLEAGATGIVIWDDQAIRQLKPNFKEAYERVLNQSLVPAEFIEPALERRDAY